MYLKIRNTHNLGWKMSLLCREESCQTMQECTVVGNSLVTDSKVS